MHATLNRAILYVCLYNLDIHACICFWTNANDKIIAWKYMKRSDIFCSIFSTDFESDSCFRCSVAILLHRKCAMHMRKWANKYRVVRYIHFIYYYYYFFACIIYSLKSKWWNFYDEIEFYRASLFSHFLHS